jgi:hypothetical protein
LRLTNELQLLYIASSWIQDLSREGIHPSLLSPLFDAIYLLKAVRGTVDWAGLLTCPDSNMAIASLYVMLTYLTRRGLDVCDPELISRLSSSQSVVGVFQRSVIHAMLDHYLVGGRYWNLFLPPPVPGRYSLKQQLQKRQRARGSRPSSRSAE